MPDSLSLNTPPPSLPTKRQRSQDSRHREPRTDSPLREQSVKQVPASTPEGSTGLRVPNYLNKSQADIGILFQELEWKQRFRIAHGMSNPDTSPYRIDRTLTNVIRNRYANVQPWDQSRIKLRKPLGGSDYVNASPIRLSSNVTAFQLNQLVYTSTSVSAATRRSNEARYIASQGPKEGQASHFWHMVMQESVGEVGVVVMLTQLYEGHKEKCAQYFPWDMNNAVLMLPIEKDPDDGDPFLDSPEKNPSADRIRAENHTTVPETLSTTTETSKTGAEIPKSPEQSEKFGTLTLIDRTTDQSIGSEVRHLRLEIDGKSKDIYHYLYVNWPDYGKPEADDRRALLELTRQSRSKAGDSPRVVHCSAGVGRTGTFIALDFLLHELEEGRITPQSKSEPPTVKTPESHKSETWGRSGPAKDSPSLILKDDDEDIIFQTVNYLREQRMMMVMNEIQLSFLYEVIRDCFFEKYREKETGIIVSGGVEVGPPQIGDGKSIKKTRLAGPGEELYAGGKVGTIRSEEETVSEAETEIEEDQNPQLPDTRDPYDAVAPESIRQGIDKNMDDQEKRGVEEHEVK